MESDRVLNESNPGNSREDSVWSQLDISVLDDLKNSFDPDNQNSSKLRDDNQYNGFDNNAGQHYIYPINLPIRTYQFNITKIALFRNTLVVLPTGLGKTFIAAVVMYNIYRWYPTCKIIFMAPTRPLVSQQIDACRQIMGIPANDIAEMTGKQNKKLRIDLWQEKRIFFATPQVVQIDINDPEMNFPFDRIKSIVVDEAHKAKGKYAYSEVIQSVFNRNPYFRVLALSATPGRRIEDVMEIIQNLCISHIEVRNENSIDVLQYTFKKHMKTIVIPLGEKITDVRNELINIIDPHVRNLIDNGVISGNTGNFTKFWLLMEQRRFRENSTSSRHPLYSSLNTDFSICISLYHALELLERHGLRVFLNFFDEPDTENKKFFVKNNIKLRNFLNRLREEIGPNPFAITDQTMTNGEIPKIPEVLDFGHPKFDMVKKFLIDHFNTQKDSRVIVFCEFRESVMLLHRLLLQNRPIIMPKMFVGQGGTGAIRAVTQKEQIQIMKDFRSGLINTLIATSVAEEGIDVGEVDLIICFDISSKNPTRFVQRIGRTGRRKQGQVIMLATEGKEHEVVKEVLASKDKVNQKLVKSVAVKNSLFRKSPRIVPPEFNPKCLEVFIKIDNNNENNVKKSKKENEVNKNNKKPGRSKRKQMVSGSQDVRNFFKKVELNPEEMETFAVPVVNMCNDLIDVDNIINDYAPVSQFTQKPSTNKPLNLDSYFRKLNHLIRHIDKKTNLPDYSNILESIKSKSINKNVKKFILKNNRKFVEQNFEAMKIIWAIDNNLNEMDDFEKDIRKVYTLIENIFGDKYEIEYFLTSNNTKTEKDLVKIFDKKYSDLFKDFQKRNFTDSIEEFINNKIEKIDTNFPEFEEEQEIPLPFNIENGASLYEHLLEKENEASLINIGTDIWLNESKYASQWDNFNCSKIKNQSTPISKQKWTKLNVKESHLDKICEKTALNRCDTDQKQPTACDAINGKINSKNYEISADLFDDDFDEILVEKDFEEFEHFSEHKTSSKSEEYLARTLELSKKSFVNGSTSSKENLQHNSKTNVIDIMKAVVEVEDNKSSRDKDAKIYSQTIHDNLKELNTSFHSTGMFGCDDIFEMIPIKNETTIDKSISEKLEFFEADDFLEPFDEEIKCTKERSQKENSPPPHLNINNQPQYSNFKTPQNVSNRNISFQKTPQTNDYSPSIFSRNMKFTKPKLATLQRSPFTSRLIVNPSTQQIDESVIIAPKRKVKFIIESSNSEDEDAIMSDLSSEEIQNTPEKTSVVRRQGHENKRFRKKISKFILDEAEHSDDSDDNISSLEVPDAVDSIVVSDDEVVEDDPNVNMHAKYLQSLQSPSARRNRFIIPTHKKFINHSQIFSQAVQADDSLDVYKECSFVVSDVEDISDSSEICPLEEAEKILKAQRKAKRKKLHQKEDSVPKRRRIISPAYNDEL